MRQVMRRVVAGCCMVMSLSCAGLPGNMPDVFNPEDYRDPPGASLKFADRAPVVVVGKTVSIRKIGSPRRAARDARLLIQLLEVYVEVENELRVIESVKNMSFYVYTAAEEQPVYLGVARYMPVIGERRVFFLKPYGRAYRSVGDVTDYTIPVYSGGHSRDFCGRDSVGNCIAKIILTPGCRFDRIPFLEHLRQTAGHAETLSSKEHADRLLGSLVESNDTAISRVARRIASGALLEAAGSGDQH